MGDNIAFVETFSIIGNNPSILGLQNDKFKHLDLRGGNIDELHSIPYYLLEEVKSTLESLVLSHNHFDKIGHTGRTYDEDKKTISTNSTMMSLNIFPAMEKLLSLELDACKIRNIWIQTNPKSGFILPPKHRTDHFSCWFPNPLRLQQVLVKPRKTTAVHWRQREGGLLSLVKICPPTLTI